jgi:HlyD family secretion protein
MFLAGPVGMDRPLADVVVRRNRRVRWAKLAVPLALLAIVVSCLPGWLRPSVSRERIRTARVTSGPIDAGFTAAGTVVPEVERVISSPLDARVLRILKRPGAALVKGEAVLELDTAEWLVAAEKAETDLRLKDNLQQQTRLGYERALASVNSRARVKALELETRKADRDGYRLLVAKGLVSKEEMRKAELAVQQAETELELLIEERASTEKTTAVQLEGLALERASQRAEVEERRRVLELATTKADRDGVLTWIVTEEGALVRRGDVLARIADLKSFRVDATTSDVHAGKVRSGLPVVVRFDDVVLEGRVFDVFPAVENSTVRFTVALAESAHPRLRASLRTDVQIVTDRKARTMKVARGLFADGAGVRPVFVVEGNRAVRRDVTLGLASFDEVEVVSGLAEGDEVIVSDMRDYAHLDHVNIR